MISCPYDIVYEEKNCIIMRSDIVFLYTLFIVSLFLPFAYLFTAVNLLDLYYDQSGGRSDDRNEKTGKLPKGVEKMYHQCISIGSHISEGITTCYIPKLYVDVKSKETSDEASVVEGRDSETKFTSTVDIATGYTITIQADVYAIDLNKTGGFASESYRKIDRLSNITLDFQKSYLFDYETGAFRADSIDGLLYGNENENDNEAKSLTVIWRDEERVEHSVDIAHVEDAFSHKPRIGDSMSRLTRGNSGRGNSISDGGRTKNLNKNRSSLTRVRGKSIDAKHYETKTKVHCSDLTDGFWPDATKRDSLTLDVVRSIESANMPINMTEPLRDYMLCKDGVKIKEFKCNEDEVYAGQGNCWRVDDHGLECLERWAGFGYPLKTDPRSYIVCRPFDRLRTNYDTFTCKGSLHNVFDVDVQSCVDARLRCQSTTYSLTTVHDRDVASSDPGMERHSFECLDGEIRTLTSSGKSICADPACYKNRYVEYIDEECINEFDHVNFVKFPGAVFRCNAQLRLERFALPLPWFRRCVESMSGFDGLYSTYYLPLLYFAYDGDENSRGGESLVKVVTRYAETLRDLPHDLFTKGKVRVSHKRFGQMMDFCALSLHTHVKKMAEGMADDGTGSLCTIPECCIPEVLDDIELKQIQMSPKPYYACSWVQKTKLFIWNDLQKRFLMYMQFDKAVGLYSNALNRLHATTNVLFEFNSSREPHSNTQFDTDEVKGFANDSVNPSCILGYFWKRVITYNDRQRDPQTDNIAKRINSQPFPDNFTLREDGSLTVNLVSL